MEGDLRAMLVGHAPLTALVGQRIYWDEVPQGADRPCIVMYLVSGSTGYHMQGPDKLTSARIQFDCQAVLSTDKWAMADALEALLSGYRGAVGGTYFDGMFLALGRDKTEPATNSGTFRVRQLDFEIWFRRAS